MRIGTLAERTGVTQKALRTPERLGVRTPVRGDNGHRVPRRRRPVVTVVRSLGRPGIPVEETASTRR